MLQCDDCMYKPAEGNYCSKGSVIDAAFNQCSGYTGSKSWLTNVETGADLNKYLAVGKEYSHRDCYTKLQEYLHSNSRKPCALFGLRRTGKTIMLYQLLAELDKDKTAYILMTPHNDMTDLITDLLRLQRAGVTTVLVDEITFASDFASSSSILADYFTLGGIKLVLTGTDSLGFVLAQKRTLFDRLELIHTTYISYPEHKRLLSTSIDEYVKYGGTLLPENQTPFRSIVDANAYKDSAIVDNIQHAFSVLDDDPQFYTALKDAYYAGALAGMINLIIDDVKHRFVTSIFRKEFKSSNLGAVYKKLLERLKNSDMTVVKPLEFLGTNKKSITEEYKRDLQVGRYVPSEQELLELQKYLFELDVLDKYDIIDADFKTHQQIIFTQPGMQFATTEMLIDICKSTPEFSSLTITEQEFILRFLETNTLGHILEDIVISHTVQAYKKYNTDIFPNFMVFQYSYNLGEIDMVVVDTKQKCTHLYEIKHSSEAVANQAKHLCNAEVCMQLARKYYPITSRNVLYLGKSDVRYVYNTEFTDDSEKGVKVNYLNIEDYLNTLV